MKKYVLNMTIDGEDVEIPFNAGSRDVAEKFERKFLGLLLKTNLEEQESNITNFSVRTGSCEGIINAEKQFEYLGYALVNDHKEHITYENKKIESKLHFVNAIKRVILDVDILKYKTGLFLSASMVEAIHEQMLEMGWMHELREEQEWLKLL